jgi:hypothetical protein
MDLSKFFSKIILAMVQIMVVTCIQGLTLSSLWGWFVVPFGAPLLGFVPACGIMLLVSLILPHSQEQAARASSDWILHVSFFWFLPLILLFVGWVLHFWM